MAIKNIQSLVNRQVAVGEGQAKSLGVVNKGFIDKQGTDASQADILKPSTNRAALIGGGQLDVDGADLGDIDMGGSAAPTKNYVTQTPGGHTFEINDTPQAERIQIRHKDGHGVNIGPDGSIVIASTKRVDVVTGDHKLTVTGDGVLTYSGNLKLDIAGDFEVDCDRFVVNARDKSENIAGNSSATIVGNQSTTVTGNQSNTIVGSTTGVYLGTYNMFSKGQATLAAESNIEFRSGGTMQMSATSEIDIASADVNVVGKDLSVVGATGTIGGESMYHYGKNYYGTSATFTAGVTAPTFHGDLDGLADEAVTTNKQEYNSGQDENPSGVPSITDTATDTDASEEPTAGIIDAVLESDKGSKEVVIDPDDVLKDTIDNSTKTGGVTNAPLTTQSVRQRMREPSNRSNADYTTKAVADGTMSQEWPNQTPPSIAQVIDPKQSNARGSGSLGNQSPGDVVKSIKGFGGNQNTTASASVNTTPSTGADV